MPDDPNDYALREHALYMEERKGLVDAARESSRTFDQATLAFGSAAFAASIAFLKDVAPHPQAYSLKWLAISWGLFSIGLLSAMLSFLFSHKACMFEIEIGTTALGKPDWKRPKNRWSTVTDWCNYSCIVTLFVGLVFWSVFAVENLGTGENTVSNVLPQREERGYVPPPPAPRIPPSTTPPSSLPAPPPAQK